MNDHQPIPGPHEDDADWQKTTREDGTPCFGATKAAPACGVSRYETAQEVCLEYMGELPPNEFDETTLKRMRRGRRMQAVMAPEYADEMGVEIVEPLRRFFHPLKAFMSCTPDALVLPESSRKGVEFKSTTPMMYGALTALDSNKYGEEGSDAIPTETFMQVQQQMDVMNWTEVDVVVFFGVFTMRVYPIQRDDQVIDAITDAEQELSERIIARDPPEPDWEHPRTRELLREMHGYVPNTVVELGDREFELWRKCQKAGQIIKKVETVQRGWRNQLLDAIGGAEIGRLGHGKELRRVVIKDQIVTEADVAKLQEKIGTVKRKGHEQLRERKVKT